MNMAKLNEMQHRFIEEYFNTGFNATKAAINAGYSEKSAASMGSMLLKKPHIAAKVKELQEQIADEFDINVEWLQKELIENIRIARESGKIAAANEALKMIGQTIAAFQQGDGDNITVNILELLGNIDKQQQIQEADVRILEG